MREPKIKKHGKPIQTVQTDHDAKGRFSKGNRASVGHGGASAHVRALRQAIINAVSTEDIKAIIRRLVRLARSGDIAAAKLVLERVAGRLSFSPGELVEQVNEDVFIADERFD